MTDLRLAMGQLVSTLADGDGIRATDAEVAAATEQNKWVAPSQIGLNPDVAANTADRHVAVTVADSDEIDLTLSGQQISASLKAGSIDETKLDASVNASLDLADSAVQPAAIANMLETSDIGVSVQAWHTNLDDWSNVNPVGYYTAAQINAGFQPLDADLTALAAAGNSAVLAATTASFTTADETKLDGIEAGADVTPNGAPIFLVATGQSNMAAAAALSWSPEPNLFLWNNDAVAGVDPVGTAFEAMPSNIMNPAYAWANEYAKAHPLSNVYLVVCAEADTTIADWMTGSPSPDMYDYVKDATEAALAEVSLSTIDGLIWWQGESDAIAGTTTYYANFNTVVTRFRGETWFPDSTPITIMGLCEGDGSTVANFNQYLVQSAAHEPGIRRFVRTYLVGSWNVDNLHMSGGADYQQAGILAYRGAQNMGQYAYVDPFSGDFISRRDYDGSHKLIVLNDDSGSSAEANLVVENASGQLRFDALAGAFAGFGRLIWSGVAGLVLATSGSASMIFQTSLGNVLTLGASILSSLPLGYQSGVGTGGTVTQATSKSTGVTLNKAVGKITMHNATLNAATIVSFTFTNSLIATDDLLLINIDGGATNPSAYTVQASCGAGSATVSLRNNTAGNLGEALVLSYAIIKGATT